MSLMHRMQSLVFYRAMPTQSVLCMHAQAVLNVTGRGPVLDIAISGLPGWVAVQCDQDRGRLQMRVWTPPGIEAYLRPPLPAA